MAPQLRYRNRSLGFTSLGIRFVLLTLGVGIAAINTGNNLLYLILAMMLSFIVLSGILSEHTLRGLHVVRMLPAHLFAGREVPVSFKIFNRKRRLTSLSFSVAEQPRPSVQSDPVYVYSLAAGANRILGARMVCRKRGRLALSGIRFETTFPFGFFRKSLVRELSQEVVVFPDIVPLAGRAGADTAGLGDSREIHASGHGSSMRNLRTYLPQDDARSIHWKASARGGALLTKEFEDEEEHQYVLSLYNLPRDRTPEALESFERAVSLAASLAYHWLMRDGAVEIRTLSGSVPMGKGTSHLLAVLRFLGLLEPAPGPGPFDRTAGSAATGNAARILILPEDARPPGIATSGFNRVLGPADWVSAAGPRDESRTGRREP